MRGAISDINETLQGTHSLNIQTGLPECWFPATPQGVLKPIMFAKPNTVPVQNGQSVESLIEAHWPPIQVRSFQKATGFSGIDQFLCSSRRHKHRDPLYMTRRNIVAFSFKEHDGGDAPRDEDDELDDDHEDDAPKDSDPPVPPDDEGDVPVAAPEAYSSQMDIATIPRGPGRPALNLDPADDLFVYMFDTTMAFFSIGFITVAAFHEQIKTHVQNRVASKKEVKETRSAGRPIRGSE